MAQSQAVLAPNLGLYFDRPEIAIPRQGLADAMNVAVKNGKLDSSNLGWTQFSANNWSLNGTVMLINSFIPRGLSENLIFVTTKDIYRYDQPSDLPVYLTPRYATGTASASGTAVTGVGTAWNTNTNVKAGDQISFGNAAQTSLSATWYTIATVNSDLSITLTASAGTIAAGAYTIRQLFKGGRRNYWDWSIFTQDGTTGNDLWFATNGIDWVVTWDGIADHVTLHPELGFTCKAVTAFQNMMIYGNVTSTANFFTSFINSDIGFPLHAGSVGTGVSGQFRVHEGSDVILLMLQLGNWLVVYSQKSLTVVQFIGAPVMFAFRQVGFGGYGPVSRSAVADWGDHHTFVNLDMMYTFDGVSVRAVNGHVWRDIVRQGDPSRRDFIFAHWDEQNGALIWTVPLNSDPGTFADRAATSAFVEHYLEDIPQGTPAPYSKRAMPFTADGYYTRKTTTTWNNAKGSWMNANYAWNDQFFALNFPLNLFGDDNGNIWTLNTAQTGNGAVLPSWARFGRIAPGMIRSRALLRRVYVAGVKYNSTIDVQPFLADNETQPLTSAGIFSFNSMLPEAGYFVSIFRRARFFSIQFGSAAGNPWAIDGFDLDVTQGGKR